MEQLLTQLAMPVGLLWAVLGLFGAIMWMAGRRGVAEVVLVLWIGLTVAGNRYVGAGAMRWLERDYREVNPAQRAAECDAVAVLGGGVSLGPRDKPRLNGAGDRVALGASLHHEGAARLIVATGGAEEEAAERTARMLGGLGVPEEKIVKVPGENTKAEMRELADLAEQEQWERTGVVTSAWHMRRAMRLAGNAEFDAEPLPADFRGRWPDSGLATLVPSAGALCLTEIAVREILAGVVGR